MSEATAGGPRADDALAFALSIIATVREPLVILDAELGVERANRSFYATFGVTPEETVGRRIYDLGNGQWDIPKLRRFLEEILPAGSAFDDFEVEHDFEKIGPRTMVLNARRVAHEGGKILLAIEDVTDRKRAEHSLATSRQRLKYAAQAAGVGFWYCDLPFDVLAWDDRVKAHFHLPAHARVTIETFYDRIHPDDREPTRQAIEGSIVGRTPYRIDYRTVDPAAGAVKWIRAVGGALYDKDGRPITFDGITLDITDRKRVEDELNRARERLLFALEASEFVGTWDWDIPAGLITADERFARLYSVDPEQAADGAPLSEFTRAIHPDDFARIGPIIERVATDGGKFDEEYRLIQPDGSTRWVVARGQCQLDGEGRPIRFAGAAIDITERKAAQRRLEESEARFRHLADAMPQIVFAARPDGHVDYFNRKWYEYTGFPEDGSEGHASWVGVHETDQLDRIDGVWDEAVRTGRPYQIEYRLRRADGQFRWHLGRALPIRDADGAIVRWYGTNTDIDDQKRAEASITEARDAAEAANRMKDEFLTTLSHELRTPLNAIFGWAKLLRSGRTDAEDLEEGLEAIERNSIAQARIIEDLLDISRIVSGNFQMEVQRVELASVIDAAVGAVMPAAQAKGVRIQKLLDSLASPVMGDAARLQQVVWNLVANAVKFTPKGGQVRVLLERVNSHLEISVIDTGAGIAPEFLPLVFDRFRQADSSTTRRHGGLGLGLSIVKNLVEMHGGSVRAKSPGAGQGATFTVALPIVVVHPEPSPPPGARPIPPDEPCEDGLLAGVRVLVVDDEPDARQLVRRALVDCHAEVALAASVDEALDLLAPFRPDVIVSDVGMPGRDGYEFLRAVRARFDSRTMPAAALTAFARAEDRRQAMLAGFQTHIAKPVDPAELVAVVASLAGRTGTS